MPGAESAKEQNMANQAVKQCYACKGEDHEIKDCKKRRNMLLRYSDSRHTNTRETKEKYGTVISIWNRKSEYEKTQKESTVCFATEAEAKRAMSDIISTTTREDGMQKKQNIHRTKHS